MTRVAPVVMTWASLMLTIMMFVVTMFIDGHRASRPSRAGVEISAGVACNCFVRLAGAIVQGCGGRHRRFGGFCFLDGGGRGRLGIEGVRFVAGRVESLMHDMRRVRSDSGVGSS